MIYIFGAHSRARTLAAYLKFLDPDNDIRGFLVDNDEDNPDIADGIRVYSISSGNSTRLDNVDSSTVYIATRGIYHKKISQRLTSLGFKEIIPGTPKFDTKIRTEYLKKYYAEKGQGFIKIDGLSAKDHPNLESGMIYVARTAFDEEPACGYELPEYASFLQVGADLTDRRLTDAGGSTRAVCDNSGDNISIRNKQFCELTGLYWIWKNAGSDFVGLEHYRRHFILPPDWLDRIIDNHVDIVLPIPLYVSSSIEGNYKERHIPEDWDFVMDYLQRNDPEYYAFADSFFKDNLYSPCNMFIMKKKVLDKYCSWVFPILFALADHVGHHDDPYQDRYPGFISERLMTMYFARNEETIKRIYADKSFLF